VERFAPVEVGGVERFAPVEVGGVERFAPPETAEWGEAPHADRCREAAAHCTPSPLSGRRNRCEELQPPARELRLMPVPWLSNLGVRGGAPWRKPALQPTNSAEEPVHYASPACHLVRLLGGRLRGDGRWDGVALDHRPGPARWQPCHHCRARGGGGGQSARQAKATSEAARGIHALANTPSPVHERVARVMPRIATAAADSTASTRPPAPW